MLPQLNDIIPWLGVGGSIASALAYCGSLANRLRTVERKAERAEETREILLRLDSKVEMLLRQRHELIN